MDKRRMIAEIAASHGVRLDPDDPAFLLVELNHMIFEEKEAELKAETEAAEKRISSLIGLLQKAGDAYRGEIVGFIKTNLTDSVGKLEKAGLATQRQIQTDAVRVKLDLDRAVAGSIEEVKRTVKTTIQIAMDTPVQDVVRTLEQNIWMNMLMCFLAGMVGGVLPVVFLALRS